MEEYCKNKSKEILNFGNIATDIEKQSKIKDNKETLHLLKDDNMHTLTEEEKLRFYIKNKFKKIK